MTPGWMIQEVLAGGYAEYLRTEFPEEERREDDIRQLAEFAAQLDNSQSRERPAHIRAPMARSSSI